MNQALLLARTFSAIKFRYFPSGGVAKTFNCAPVHGGARIFVGLPALRQDAISLFLHTSRGSVAFRVYFVGLGVSSMPAALKLKRRSGLSCLRKDMRAELSIIMSHRLGDGHPALICTRV